MIPFSTLDNDGHFVDNIIDERIDLEKIVEVKMQIEELNKALATLTKKERELIEAIFYRKESLRSICNIVKETFNVSFNEPFTSYKSILNLS